MLSIWLINHPLPSQQQTLWRRRVPILLFFFCPGRKCHLENGRIRDHPAWKGGAGIKNPDCLGPRASVLVPLSFVYSPPAFTPSLPGIQGLLLSSTGILLVYEGPNLGGPMVSAVLCRLSREIGEAGQVLWARWESTTLWSNAWLLITKLAPIPRSDPHRDLQQSWIPSCSLL